MKKLNSGWMGLGIGLAFFLWKVTLFLLNLQYDVLVQFPIAPLMVLLFVAIIWAQFRKMQQDAQFDFIASFKAGARVALANAVVTAGLIWIFYSFIDVDYLEIMKTGRQEEAAKTLTGQELENALNSIAFINHPNRWAMFTLSGMIILGFIYSLLSAFLIRFFLVKK